MEWKIEGKREIERRKEREREWGGIRKDREKERSVVDGKRTRKDRAQFSVREVRMPDPLTSDWPLSMTSLSARTLKLALGKWTERGCERASFNYMTYSLDQINVRLYNTLFTLRIAICVSITGTCTMYIVRKIVICVELLVHVQCIIIGRKKMTWLKKNNLSIPSMFPIYISLFSFSSIIYIRGCFRSFF